MASPQAIFLGHRINQSAQGIEVVTAMRQSDS